MFTQATAGSLVASVVGGGADPTRGEEPTKIIHSGSLKWKVWNRNITNFWKKGLFYSLMDGGVGNILRLRGFPQFDTIRMNWCYYGHINCHFVVGCNYERLVEWTSVRHRN